MVYEYDGREVNKEKRTAQACNVVIKTTQKKEKGDREKVEEKMGVTVSNTYIYERRLRFNKKKTSSARGQRWEFEWV